MHVLLAAAIIAIIAYRCGGGSKKLPDLPPVRREDGGADGADEKPDAAIGDTYTDAGKLSDGGTPLSDSGTPLSDDGTPLPDSGTPLSDGGTPLSDGGTVTPPGDSYACQATAVDDYGMKYAVMIESEDRTTQTEGGWRGLMWFVPAEGTDASLTEARRSARAGTWPQNAQNIPEAARGLTATYEMSAETIQDGLKITLSSLNESSEPQEATIFPMTWADTNGLPEPIQQDTSNEIYVALKSPFSVTANCDEGCANFSGSIGAEEHGWNVVDMDDLALMTFQCTKVIQE